MYGHATLKECGKLFGITREAVRQIEAKALRKLRTAMLADPELALVIAEMFGRPELAEHTIEVKPEGFFAPQGIVQRRSLDLPAYLLEVLRVLGRATMVEIQTATELDAKAIDDGMRYLITVGKVRCRFKPKGLVTYWLERRPAA